MQDVRKLTVRDPQRRVVHCESERVAGKRSHPVRIAFLANAGEPKPCSSKEANRQPWIVFVRVKGQFERGDLREGIPGGPKDFAERQADADALSTDAKRNQEAA